MFESYSPGAAAGAARAGALVPARPCVSCLTSDETLADRVVAVLGLHAPDAEVLVTAPGERLALSHLPPSVAIVLDGGGAGRDACLVARDLRAGGYAGPLLVVARAGWHPDPAAGTRWAMQTVGAEALDAALPAALRALVAPDAADPATRALGASLARSRRLLAAGEVALGLQHAINNPLTALLAEAQLLELEPMPHEQAEAVSRIVEQCRRVAEIVRRLEVVGPRRD